MNMQRRFYMEQIVANGSYDTVKRCVLEALDYTRIVEFIQFLYDWAALMGFDIDLLTEQLRHQRATISFVYRFKAILQVINIVDHFCTIAEKTETVLESLTLEQVKVYDINAACPSQLPQLQVESTGRTGTAVFLLRVP